MMKMIWIALFIIVLILLIALFLKKLKKKKLSGGYIIPYSFIKHGQHMAVDMFNRLENGQMDRYCKSIALYFFYDVGYSPRVSRYIEGGEIAKSVEQINNFIRKHDSHVQLLESNATFIPDFSLYDGKNLLIIEFDEKGSYHQDSRTKGYTAKNYIYDQILHESYKNFAEKKSKINVVILRIKYNELELNGGKERVTIISHHKDLGVRYILSMILFTWTHMTSSISSESNLHYQYVLGYLKIDSSNKLHINEFLTLYPTNYNDLLTFTPENTFYSKFNLDSRERYENGPIIRKWNLMRALKIELFDKYIGSEYEKHVQSKKNTDIPNNHFNHIIDHMSEFEFSS